MNDGLHRVVGIDLGTTYSAVAAYDPENYAPRILEDPEFEGTAALAMPSVVRYEADTGRLVVGHGAKNAIGDGSGAETVIEIKRDMGEVFDEDRLKAYGAEGAFKKDQPVRARLGAQWLRPQEVSALVLMRMKRIAELSLGGTVNDAVVTVPAYFMERQKRATEEAALLAGLYPRQLIPEPTAAAIAYGVDRAEPERRIYLVFDLGGGTFDVSIIETRDEEIEVIATKGNQRLGGGDFDRKVADWIGEQLRDALPKDFDPLRIRAAAEAAKRRLSLAESTAIDLGDGLPVLELDRIRFEQLIAEHLDSSLTCVDDALQAARDKGVAREDVSAVLLVGGSTRIPRVKQMLLEHFGQEEGFVRGDANPDTLVARGAAIAANRFKPTAEFDLAAARPTAENAAEDQDYTITLITEHTLGVGVTEGNEHGKFSPLIQRGTKIPARKARTYSNPDMATKIDVAIYQGEERYVYENTLVGTIELDAIEARPQGYHEFEIDFSLDVNGLLGVRVVHLNTNREYEANFSQETSIAKDDELARRRELLLEMYTTARPPGASWPAPGAARAAVHRHSIPAPVSDDEDEAPAAAFDLSKVPADYGRTVRKVIAALDRGGAPDTLAQAFRAFLDGVQSDAGDQVLDGLADRLEMAYADSQR